MAGAVLIRGLAVMDGIAPKAGPGCASMGSAESAKSAVIVASAGSARNAETAVNVASGTGAESTTVVSVPNAIAAAAREGKEIRAPWIASEASDSRISRPHPPLWNLDWKDALEEFRN